MRSHTYFIADLHLDPQKPRAYEFALGFLAQIQHAKALYILGDLFEYWVGDDAGVPLYKDVVDALASLSANDCQVSIMLGNRDFLLGESFAEAAGATLVRDDELVINLDDDPTLLLHGDTLCIDDIEYQAFRQQLRDDSWQQEFLEKTIAERIAFATHLREQSREISSDKTQSLMDVNASEVDSRFAASHCQSMIHGHTHRPDLHRDKTADTSRFVVGDWHTDHAYYVVHDPSGLHLTRYEGVLGT
ncbi:MAG: UDP-2,3-diacylglucosamine diphosphatase [Granulosicoccus sp.]